MTVLILDLIIASNKIDCNDKSLLITNQIKT